MYSNGENHPKSAVIEMNVVNEAPAYTMQPPPPPYTLTVISNQPVGNQAIIVQQLQHQPSYSFCPACHQNVITRVEHLSTRKTHLAAGFIFGFTIWCMFCCLSAIPYFTNVFKKTLHYCPNCKNLIASYS